jgi:hypothetical protein
VDACTTGVRKAEAASKNKTKNMMETNQKMASIILTLHHFMLLKNPVPRGNANLLGDLFLCRSILPPQHRTNNPQSPSPFE